MLAPAVSATGLDPAGKEVEIPDKRDVLKAAFESDVGVENNALTPKDGYFWYEVREVIPSALKPFDAVKDQVKGDVIARKLEALGLADLAPSTPVSAAASPAPSRGGR